MFSRGWLPQACPSGSAFGNQRAKNSSQPPFLRFFWPRPEKSEETEVWLNARSGLQTSFRGASPVVTKRYSQTITPSNQSRKPFPTSVPRIVHYCPLNPKPRRDVFPTFFGEQSLGRLEAYPAFLATSAKMLCITPRYSSASAAGMTSGGLTRMTLPARGPRRWMARPSASPR